MKYVCLMAHQNARAYRILLMSIPYMGKVALVSYFFDFIPRSTCQCFNKTHVFIYMVYANKIFSIFKQLIVWRKLLRIILQYNTKCFHSLLLLLLEPSSAKYQKQVFKDETVKSVFFFCFFFFFYWTILREIFRLWT